MREQILQGKLAQREKLVENDIAVTLGMSRGPVRDALKQLMYEGFLDYETNKGYSVTMLSPKDAYEIFFLRGNLENLALERCGGRLLSDSIFLMEDAVLAMKEAVAEDDMGKIIQYDEIFHRQILLSGQMERLTSLWETLSPLNGAMFYTIKQINGYVSENRWIWTRKTLLPRQDGGEITIWSINGFWKSCSGETWNSPGAQSIPTT